MASFFRSVVPATATEGNGSSDKHDQDDPAPRTPPRGASPVPPIRSPARPMTPRRRMLQQQQLQRLQQQQQHQQQQQQQQQQQSQQQQHHPSQPQSRTSQTSRTPTQNQTKRRQIAETRLQNAIHTHERAQAEVDRLCDLIERAALALKNARADARRAQLELDEAARFVNLLEGGEDAGEGRRGRGNGSGSGVGLHVRVPSSDCGNDNDDDHENDNGIADANIMASPGSLVASAAARMKHSRSNLHRRGRKAAPSLEGGASSCDDFGGDEAILNQSHVNHPSSSAGRSTILDSARRRMKDGERQLFHRTEGNEENGVEYGRGRDPDEYDTEEEDDSDQHDDDDDDDDDDEEVDSSECTESSQDESSGTEEDDDEKYTEFNDHNEEEDGFDIGNEALEQIRYRLELANIEPNSPEGTKLLDDLLIRLQACKETVVDVPMVNRLIDELLGVGGKGSSTSSGYVSLSTLNATQPQMQTQPPTQQPPRIRICRNGKVLGWYEGQLDQDGISRHGSGSMYYDAGHESHGTWHKDEMTGRGIYKWSDGHMYDGEWANGKRHGLGRFIRPDGVILFGKYEKGHHRGQGVRWSADRKEAQIVVDGVPKKNVSLENAEELARKLGFEDVPPSL